MQQQNAYYAMREALSDRVSMFGKMTSVKHSECAKAMMHDIAKVSSELDAVIKSVLPHRSDKQEFSDQYRTKRHARTNVDQALYLVHLRVRGELRELTV